MCIANSADLEKENSCDDKENSIDNSRSSKQKRHNNLTTEASSSSSSTVFGMAECETVRGEGGDGGGSSSSICDNEGEDVNGNLEDVEANGKSIGKDEADDENSAVDDNEMEPGEINFNQSSALEMQAQQAAASLAMNEANSIFNNAAAMLQPGMSMQTFQNAIAQFTANAIANNMDNETVMKNLAILQSALFTLQQQQFLQFQLIQHLQSQLVTKKGDGSEIGSEKLAGKSECDDDEEQDCKMKDEIDEDEAEMEEIEQQQQMNERQNQIHIRLMESKHFSKMQETLMKESENR